MERARHRSRAPLLRAGVYAAPLPADSLGGEGQKRRIEGFLAAFPDIRLEISELFGEGGLFTFVGTIHGTHAGKFMGAAPTGRRVSVSLVDVVRVEDGRFVEHWGGPDVFGLMRQIREGS